MAPFDALYGRKCRTPVNWIETGDKGFYGIEYVQDAEEIVRTIQQHIKAAHSRQKGYADQRRRPLEFQVGDYVYLKVSPMRGVRRFGIKKKLAPRYIGPYRIIARKGKVAYQVQLPPEMSAVFPVFHVSQFKKCLRVPEEETVPSSDIRVGSDLEYYEKPERILDTKVRVTRNREVKTFKILWSNHGPNDATWETEAYLIANYPYFYEKWYETQISGRDFCKGERAVTPCVKLCIRNLISH